MRALTKLAKSLTKVKFSAMKHAPEIFMYAGIAGTIVGTVDACRKTKNMDKIVEDHNTQVEELKKKAKDIPMSEYRKELTSITLHTAGKTIKNYAEPAAIILVSVGSIMHGHRLLKKWYVDTSVALAAVTKDYNNLYDNLVAEVGEEKAKEIKAGIVTEEVEETITDAKGKDKVIKKKVKRLGDNGSVYTLKWNKDTADEWTNDFEMNCYVVKARIAELQHKIMIRETQHLFWHEAVEFLFGSAGLKKILDQRKSDGLPCPILGGWVYSSDKKCSQQVYADYMADPEDPTGLLIVIIPEGNINELGVGIKGIEERIDCA